MCRAAKEEKQPAAPALTSLATAARCWLGLSLVGWLVGWLVGLIGLVGWSVGWLVSLVGLIGLVGWLVGWLVSLIEIGLVGLGKRESERERA